MVSTFPVYIISVVGSLFFILIAALISNSIKFEGGAYPKDPGKRKMWFWIMGILAPIANLLFGLFVYYFPQNNNYAKAKLITAIGIGSAVTFIAYLLVGFILSKVFKNGKLGNWF
jgi:sulfoxide reductase heme-binding subunit YedZ